jgi:formate hydrogenlyase transcriptional activator
MCLDMDSPAARYKVDQILEAEKDDAPHVAGLAFRVRDAVDAPTERHRGRHELEQTLNEARNSEAWLRKIIDTIPAQAYCNLPDGTNEFSNQRWQDYTGQSSEESSGWGWQAAYHPEDLPRTMEKWRALLASGEPGETQARLRRHDGVYRWFLFRCEPLRDGSGEVVRWYGVNTDIDDLKRTEEKLREDEREFRRITDAIPQSIVVLDPDGMQLYANRTLLNYTGLTTQDVTSPGFRERIFHPEDIERLEGERQAALALGAPFEFEERTRGEDGQYRWFLIRYSPFRNEQGSLVRWYATGTDINDRKRAEDRTQNENLALREEIEQSSMFEEIVGSSAALRLVLSQVSKVAPTDSTVLILGETGTGKELLARAIHNRSRRSKRAFIRVNCGAIPPSLIESELFGHEKGSFTGALQRRIGRFEMADGGTIFLDEVGELPSDIQIALLRVLQEREFERLGGSQTISVDVRIIAATNRDLDRAVSEGTFRQDLFYRINVFPIKVPPLRERAEDVSLLLGYLINRFAQKSGKKIRNVDRHTMDLFRAYDWPGNIRELQNVVERAVILCEGDTFAVEEVWLKRTEPSATLAPASSLSSLVDREREMIEKALVDSKGVIGGAAGAAVRLGIPRQTLESKIKKLGIKLQNPRR